jgi:nucleoside 2-deoxyribosyltransferase
VRRNEPVGMASTERSAPGARAAAVHPEGGRPARRRACAISDFGLIQLNKLGTSIDSGTIYKIGLKIKQNGPLLRPG